MDNNKVTIILHLSDYELLNEKTGEIVIDAFHLANDIHALTADDYEVLVII